MSAMNTTTTPATKTINPALYVEYATTLEQFNTLRAALDKITLAGGKAFEAEAFPLWLRAWRRLEEMRPQGWPAPVKHRRSTPALVRFEYAREQVRILKATMDEITRGLDDGRPLNAAESAIFVQYRRAKDHLKKKRDIFKAEKPKWPAMFASSPPPISKADKRALDAMARAWAAQEAAR